MQWILSWAKPRIDSVEATLVALILAPTAYYSGGRMTDWISAVAVFLSFLCTQIAFEMSEQHRGRNSKSSPPARYRKIFLLKECFWIATCIGLGNYPLLASTFVFASYPLWRLRLRRICADAEREILEQESVPPRMAGFSI